MLSLTATQLPRFMACNGSRLMGGSPPFDQDDSVTEEGNAAHWLIEQVFTGQFTAEELIDRKAPNGVYITAEMVEHCEEYLIDTQGVGVTEVDTSYSGPPCYEIRGRADHIRHNQNRLYVSDFKYGWKIVEPENNWTLISHAIGFLSRNAITISDIHLRIYQPRPFHPDGSARQWIISYDELMQYWQTLRTALENPSDHVVSSPHCYKCPSLSQCPAAQIASMNAVDVAHKAFDSEIDNERLSWMLDNLKRAQDVLKQSLDAYEDVALHRLKAGQTIPEYTAQSGLGKTRWKDGVDGNLMLALTGVNVTAPKMITPNQAKEAGVPEDIVKAYTERPSTGFKLVRQSVSKKAEKLFGEKML